MTTETGYLHLNVANDWASFIADGDLHGLEVAPDGSLTLANTNEGMFVRRGVFLGGPVEVQAAPTPWYRLQAFVDTLPDETHIQLFTFTQDAAAVPPFHPLSDVPFPSPAWKAAPRDELDVLILNAPAQRLWIGGVVRSPDGQASPSLSQMRVEYGRDTYLNHLPAMYGHDDSHRDFLERFLSLHESVLGGLEETISDLPGLFDPFAVPNGAFPSWLSWLNTWLALDENQAWSEDETRHALAEAFDLYGKRGTVEGLRRYLKLYAGVEARIEEPGFSTTLWSLGENSTLGFSTMLAPAALQGAVVGTSATLDQSHLTRGEEFGAALFEDVAHRFCVQVYCAELNRSGALEDVRLVLDREKPAHTVYHLCVIEPHMRIGVQARIGIDTIVAKGPPAAQVGMVLGTGTLAATSDPCTPDEEDN